MHIEIQTLTPLWTGGANGECDRFHETGLIGSLRWWYEVVVRGLGGRACDPTAKESGDACSFDADRYEGGLCHACQVFGATGWQKVFRLEVDDFSLKPVMKTSPKGLLLPSGRCHERKGRTTPGGWYILPALQGTFCLNCHRRRARGEKEDEELIQLLFSTIRLMENWTAIGAKETAGYGVFKIEALRPKPKFPKLNPFPDNQDASENKNGSVGLPYFTDFFFAKIRFKPKDKDWWQNFREVELTFGKQSPCGDSRKQLMQEKHFKEWLDKKSFPLSPIVRNWLRYTWYKKFKDLKPAFKNLKSFEDLIFGTAGDNRRRTAIGISHAYQQDDGLWEFRIWGHRPSGVERNEWQNFLNQLYLAMKPSDDKRASSKNGKTSTKVLPSVWNKPVWEYRGSRGWQNEGGLFGDIAVLVGFVWREFDSERDTVQRFADSEQWQFFKSLVKGEEKKGA